MACFVSHGLYQGFLVWTLMFYGRDTTVLYNSVQVQEWVDMKNYINKTLVNWIKSAYLQLPSDVSDKTDGGETREKEKTFSDWEKKSREILRKDRNMERKTKTIYRGIVFNGSQQSSNYIWAANWFLFVECVYFLFVRTCPLQCVSHLISVKIWILMTLLTDTDARQCFGWSNMGLYWKRNNVKYCLWESERVRTSFNCSYVCGSHCWGHTAEVELIIHFYQLTIISIWACQSKWDSLIEDEVSKIMTPLESDFSCESDSIKLSSFQGVFFLDNCCWTLVKFCKSLCKSSSEIYFKKH